MTRDVTPLPGYRDPYGLLCAILQDGTNEWRGELWGIDPGPEEVTWRMRPGGQSIGAVMLHLILVEVFWMEQFALGRPPSDEDKRVLMWDEIDVDEGRWPDPPSQPLSWYFALHDRFRARTLEAVREWPDPNQTIEHHGDRVSLRWVFGHVIQHEAYHGGQIVLLHDLLRSGG